MIVYREGCLGVSPNLLLRVAGSVVPKSLVWAVPASLISVGLFYFWGGVDPEAADSVGEAWKGYGSILGFLVCMRMQLAYRRFWEGVTATSRMRGEWSDAFMSLCSFCSKDPQKRAEVIEFKGLIMRLFSLLHHSALTKLMLEEQTKNCPIIDLSCLEKDFIEFCMSHPDRIDIVLVWVEQSILKAADQGVLIVAPPILTRVFSEISKGMIQLHDASKLRMYELPFPIAQMIQYLLIFHAMVSPIIASLSMPTWNWVAMQSFSSVFSLWSINYIAMEIEQPFGSHRNNLPVLKMTTEFNDNLMMATERMLWSPPFTKKDLDAASFMRLSMVQELSIDEAKNRLRNDSDTTIGSAPTSFLRQRSPFSSKMLRSSSNLSASSACAGARADAVGTNNAAAA